MSGSSAARSRALVPGALLASAAALLASGAWRLVPEGGDMERYGRYADQWLAGLLPYRDFAVEYPPGAFAAFIPPTIGVSVEDYGLAFAVAMALVLAATIVVTAATLRRLGAPPLQVAAGLGLLALSPVLLGAVALSRYDLLPAALTAAAVAAAVRGRVALGAFAAGLAAGAKLYPVVLLPVLAAGAHAAGGTRAALRTTAAFAAGAAVPYAPFVVLAPGGVAESLGAQLGRLPQVESLGASALLLADVVAGTGVELVDEANSLAVDGGPGAAVGAASTLLLAGTLAAVWWVALRAARTPAGLVACAAASVCALVVFGRVLSPQYLVWLLPLVPLVGGRLGLAATGLLAGACVLTNVWFPAAYFDLEERLEAGNMGLLALRNVLLVVLLGVLVAVARRAAREASATAPHLPVPVEAPRREHERRAA